MINDLKSLYIHITSWTHQQKGALDRETTYLFTHILENTFKSLDWSKLGVNMNEEYSLNLRSANGIVL